MALVVGTLITSAYDFQHDGIFYKFNYDRFTVSVTNDGVSYYKPEHVKYRGDVVIPASFRQLSLLKVAEKEPFFLMKS